MAEVSRDSYIRDAFIDGFSSPCIRQCFLENKTMNLQTAHEQAHMWEMARKYSPSYTQPETINAAMASPQNLAQSVPPQSLAYSTAPTVQTEQSAMIAAVGLIVSYVVVTDIPIPNVQPGMSAVITVER